MSDPNTARGATESGDAWAEVYGNQRDAYIRRDMWKRRNLRWLAWALSILIPIMAINEALYVWEDPNGASGGEDAGPVPFEVFVTATYFHPSGVSLVLFLIIVVTFITWQFKHAQNANRLGQTRGLGSGWAIGGWIIPFAYFILPVIQLANSSRVSNPPPDQYGRASSRTGLIVLWAVVYHLSTFEVAATISDDRTTDAVNLSLGLLIIPAAILALVMIWQLTTRQETALEAQGL